MHPKQIPSNAFATGGFLRLDLSLADARVSPTPFSERGVKEGRAGTWSQGCQAVQISPCLGGGLRQPWGDGMPEAAGMNLRSSRQILSIASGYFGETAVLMPEHRAWLREMQAVELEYDRNGTSPGAERRLHIANRFEAIIFWEEQVPVSIPCPLAELCWAASGSPFCCSIWRSGCLSFPFLLVRPELGWAPHAPRAPPALSFMLRGRFSC